MINEVLIGEAAAVIPDSAELSRIKAFAIYPDVDFIILKSNDSEVYHLSNIFYNYNFVLIYLLHACFV